MWWISLFLPIAAEGFFLYVQRRDIKELRKYLEGIHNVAHETLERDTGWEEAAPGDGDIHSRYNAVKQALVAVRALTRQS